MSTTEKIKRTILVALGFAFSTYLIMNGVAILNQDDTNATKSEVTK
jgi:hypothetical protein